MPERPNPNDPAVGTKFTVVDNLTVGDLAYFEPTIDGRLLLRKMHRWQLARHRGTVLRLEPGDSADSGVLRKLSEAEVRELHEGKPI